MDKDIQRVYREFRIDKHVSESQFKRIFRYFFAYEEAETLKELVEARNFPITQHEMTSFIQSYKLAFEEKHMQPFIQLFYSIDRNEDSALNLAECRILIDRLVDRKEEWTEQEKTDNSRALWR